MSYLPSSILASKPALKPPVHRAWDSGVLIGYTVERATERVHLFGVGGAENDRSDPKLSQTRPRVRLLAASTHSVDDAQGLEMVGGDVPSGALLAGAVGAAHPRALGKLMKKREYLKLPIH